MPSFYQLMGVDPRGFDLDRRFVTSWLLPPLVLACLRLLFAVYGFVVIFASWGYDGTHSDGAAIGQTFSYFTWLTYWGINFYMLVAGIHTLVYATKGFSWLYRWPRSLQALHSLFYTTVITFPFLVTLVYWLVLYSNPWFPIRFRAFENVSQHALNSFTALCEIFLPATNPPPWLHLPFLILILLLYLSLAYVTYATQGFYTYSFLDPAHGRGRVAAYSFGIAAGIVVTFLIVYGVIWLRRKWTRPGKKSTRDVALPSSGNHVDIEMHQNFAK